MDYSQIINEELGGKRKEKKSSEASNYKKGESDFEFKSETHSLTS